MSKKGPMECLTAEFYHFSAKIKVLFWVAS